jgi:hypothetical protein
MKAVSSNRGFAARPSDPDTWVRKPDSNPDKGAKSDLFTARLTIDVTPELRGRIKVAAFGRGITVADMLRDLLSREFQNKAGDTA